MSTVVSHPAVVATGNKFLWGAIGALSISTLALGAVVLHQQTKTATAEAPIEVLAISTPAAATPVVTAPPSVVAPDKASTSVHAEKKQSKPTSAQDNQAPRATKVIAQQPAAKAPATPVVAPAPVATDDAIAAHTFKYDEAQLLAMNRQQVALQLAVLSSEASLQRFNKTYPQLDSLVYQRSLQGKTQWVILLAPFSSATAANQQLAQLPEALRASGPFVKRLQAVQKEINALRRNQQSVPE